MHTDAGGTGRLRYEVLREQTGQPPQRRDQRANAHNQHWVATQLVRRLADPRPSDGPDVALSGPDAETEWARVRQRCLSVAVAMLEEAR